MERNLYLTNSKDITNCVRKKSGLRSGFALSASSLALFVEEYRFISSLEKIAADSEIFSDSEGTDCTCGFSASLIRL